MAFSYKIDKEHRLILTTVWGTFTLTDALSLREKMARDPDFDSEYSQIVDFAQCKDLNFSTEDIRRLVRQPAFSPGSRRAVVSPNDLGYGLGRMYETLRENEGDTGLRVFRTLEEALDWVLCKPLSG